MVAGGVARDVEPDGSRNAHVLYIWGSNGERGRVLIDGAALNGPLHLGGMLPPVDPELLSAAELRSGGVSPRHDGGTTYVMDFATRPARTDGVHVSGEADLLTGRLAVETPLGSRGGVIVGARRVNHELVDRLLGRPFGYGYGDVLARGDYAFGERGRLQGTFFTTHESIDIPRDLGQDEASWRNIAAAVAWHATGPGAFRTARASYGRGTADLPLLSAPDGHLRATVERFAAAAERTWDIGGTTGIVGAEVEHLRYDRISGAASDPTVPISLAVQCTQSLPCAKAASTGFAAFGETTWRVGGSWSARAGVRVAYEDAKPSVQLLPRIALTGLIGEQGLVTISAGRFSQPYVGTPAANQGPETGGDPPLTLDNTTVVHAHATHVEINAVRRGGRTSLSATAFLRRHDAQPAGAEARATPGVDLSWTYDAGDFSTSLGYSFARSPVVILAGDSVRNRHLVAAGIGASRGPFVLQASAAYGAGLPLASLVLEHPDQIGERIRADAPTITGGNTVPERTRPPRNFLRLDASLGAELRFRTGGRDALLTPYVKIMNALSDREALFYYHEAQIGGEPRPLATLPAIPVFGIRWAF
jgi:hypothetical protein